MTLAELLATPSRTLRGGRSATRCMALAGCLATALLPAASAHAQKWQTTSDDGSIRMESRALPGERFDELRVSTLVAVPPEAIADYLVGAYLDLGNRNIRRTFIQRSRELTIWSDIVKAPAISERCYSMRLERAPRQANGEIRVRFSSLAYIGKEPPGDCIALTSRGEWVMAPAGKGTRLSYVALTDVGGRLPARLVRRSLSAAAILGVRKVAAGAAGLKPPRGIGDH